MEANSNKLLVHFIHSNCFKESVLKKITPEFTKYVWPGSSFLELQDIQNSNAKNIPQNLMLSLIFSIGNAAASAVFRNFNKDIGTQKR